MSVSFEINTPRGPAFQSPRGPVLLADLFDADQELGVIKWRYRPDSFFPSKNVCDSWNTRCAGKWALASGAEGGYKVGKIFGNLVRAHRIIFAMNHGHWPTEQVDHINGIRSDNRACNLRDVSGSENRRNSANSKKNTSGIIGVNWHKAHQKWRAEIKVDGKGIHIGLFNGIESAALARKSAEITYGFHPNHGRKAMGAESAHQ